MSPASVLLLSACSSGPPASGVLPPEPPSEPTPIRLDEPSGARTWRLLDHLAEGTYSFPPGDATAGADVGRFVLQKKWTAKTGKRGKRVVYAHDLPFSTSMPRPNYAPFGARLVHDGHEIPFTATYAVSNGPITEAWSIDHGKIKLYTPDDPNAWSTPAELVVDELAAALRERQFATAGRSAEEFARIDHESDGVTRPGLFLPAPATAEFPVTLPARGTLHFGLALLGDPISGKPRGDGVDLRVSLDGTEVWSGHISAKEPNPDVAVSLPAGEAGRAAKLQFASTNGEKSVGDHLVVTAPYLTADDARPPRHVVVIGVDTLRWDALSENGASRPTSPELDAWLQTSVQFTRAYSAAPRTKPSFRTAFTGRFPPRSKGASTIAEVLAPNGFATGGVVGNIHLVPRFRFNAGMDHWHYENGAKGGDQVDRALAWARAHEDEDSFLFVHFMDPHTFYEAPAPYLDSYQGGRKRPAAIPARFNRGVIYSLMRRGRLNDEGKSWIRAAYDEEVAYTSHEVSRLLAGLEAIPGQTLSILHADHGEEFWDHGAYEHNHTLYDELVHVELAMRPPGGLEGAPKVTTPVGLVDIAATVFDFLGVPAGQRPTTDGVSLRPFVDRGAAAAARPALEASLATRPLLLGSLRYGRDRWGVVLGDEKYVVQTTSGEEELYDLVADPKERDNRIGAATPERLAVFRAALAQTAGWPVRPGLRLVVPDAPVPTTFRFAAPVVQVEILDPDLGEELRANLEWGEVPNRTIPEVGSLVVAADNQGFTYTPGPKAPGGVILVHCEVAPCPALTVEAGGPAGPLTPGDTAGPGGWIARPGPVFVPADSTDVEEGAPAVTGQEIDQLKVLGYIEEEDEGEGDREPK